MRITLSFAGQRVEASLEDNATTTALRQRLPLTLRMQNRYGRELVHRLADPLPAQEAGTRSYTVGQIAYWTPLCSFVLFYAQNGEVIDNLQPVGHVDGSSDVFADLGDIDITFDLIAE